MSDTDYTDLVDMNGGTTPYNFASTTMGITPVSNIYTINFAYIVSSTDVSALNYTPPGQSNIPTDYSGTSYAADFAGEINSQVQTALQTILAPAGTVAYTDYFSDVADLSFNKQTDTDSTVQVEIGTTTDVNNEFTHATAPSAALTDSAANLGQYGDIWLNYGQIGAVVTGAAVLPTSGTFSGTGEILIEVGAGTPSTVVVGSDTTAQVLTQLNAVSGITATTDSSNHIVIRATSATTIDIADGLTGYTGGLTDLGLTAGLVNPGINWASTSSSTFAPGSEAFWDLLHELGHSMGLDHPLEGNPSATNNNLQYSIMATDPSDPNSIIIPGLTSAIPFGLQLDDIQAIQSIYGANYSTRSGNDAYGLGHGFGLGPSGYSASNEFTYAIWDGGGVNVIDASSYTGPGTINLNQGAFSSIGPGDTGAGTSIVAGEAVNNVAIAYGSIIQNAIGTQNGTTFIGNQWNNVFAGTGGSNTFYSDEVLYDLTPVDWSHNGNPTTVGTQWSDPNYITPAPSGYLKENVLIGDGTENTFYSGTGNTIIDGGYNKTDIDSAAASVNTSWGASGSANYWDAAGQFTGTNNISGSALSNISDSSANSGNVADYSKLHLEDSAIASGLSSTSTTPGITISWTGQLDQGGNPEYTVAKGADSADGTDVLINVQSVVGSGAHDKFVQTGVAPTNLLYSNDGGNFHAIFTQGENHADNNPADPLTGIVQFAGTGNTSITVQGTVAAPITDIYASIIADNFPAGTIPSGDEVIGVSALGGAGLMSGTPIVYFDATAAAAGTGVQNLDLGGYSVSAEVLANYLLSDTTSNTLADSPSQFFTDLYGSSGPTSIAPVGYYDSSGNLTGMYTPDYVSGGLGSFIDPTLGLEVDHPWVVTSYATSGASTVVSLQTYVQSMSMYEAASDIRIVFNGPSADTLTVYAMAESKSFTVPDFTQGMTIHGVAMWDTATYGAAQSNITSLSAASAGSYGADISTSATGGAGFDITYFLEEMGFSDGTVWNMHTGGLTFTAALDSQSLYSRDGHNDTLVAACTDNFLHGSTGNTTMIAGPESQLYNGTGTDTDVFSAGAAPISSGGDTIIPSSSGGTVTIDLTGIAPSAVNMSDNSAGELIIQYSSTDLITVEAGSYSSSTGESFHGLTAVAFDSSYSTTWSLTGGLDLTASSSYQSLYGTSAGGDTLTAAGNYDYLYGFGGTETLVAGYGCQIYNGTGTDTDVFTAGAASSSSGDYLAANTSGGTATIDLHGINPDAVTMWDDTSGNLMIQFSSADLITIHGGSFSSGTGVTLAGLSEVAFDPSYSTTWSLTGGLNLTAAANYEYLYGTSSGGDTLTATGNYNNLYAYAGNETIVAGSNTTIYNGTGNDTDVFTSGFGSGTIHANASGGSSNSIVFHSVTAGQLALSDDTSGNLYIQDTVGDQITLAGGSYNSTTGFTPGNVQQIALDGATDINLSGALNLTATGYGQSLYGTGHGDTMTAGADHNFLHGIAGNNTMTGAADDTTYMYGGSGNDTMIDGGGSATNNMTMGSGNDTVKIESASSSTTISGFSEAKDVLDIADIMTGYDPVHDALADWVKETPWGGTTYIQVDPTGTGTFSGYQVTASGVTLDDVATMVANGSLVVHH